MDLELHRIEVELQTAGAHYGRFRLRLVSTAEAKPEDAATDPKPEDAQAFVLHAIGNDGIT